MYYPGLTRDTLDLPSARKDARSIDLAATELRKIAPNAGSYISGSNYFNRSWQQISWGSNDSRLRAIKTKYDSDGLFFVHRGVGSEAGSPDGFTRLLNPRAAVWSSTVRSLQAEGAGILKNTSTQGQVSPMQ